MSWHKGLKVKVKLKEPLKSHTTFKIGGKAQFFAQPKDESELKLLINCAKRYNIPVLVIGAGSNILAADNGVRGLVIHLSAPFFRRISLSGGFLEAASGVTLNKLSVFARERSLSGTEFLAGIPATVGGALVMNAGITEQAKSSQPKIKSIGNLVVSVTVMDYEGKTKVLKNKDLKFGYRKSNLSQYIVLSALLKLRKASRRVIKDNCFRYMSLRKDKLDLSWPSAGCIFKNPPGHSAGLLIDLCGLKGKRVKDARISQKHANFILNTGRARASDVLALIALIKKRVKGKFNVSLEPEIKIWK